MASERPTPKEGARAKDAADFARVTEAKTRAMLQDAALQGALAELRQQKGDAPLFGKLEVEPGAVQPSERAEHVAIEALKPAVPAVPVEAARVEVSAAVDPRRAP